MSANQIDRSTGVRSGEELNAKDLSRYLQQQLPHLSGSMSVEQFPRGFSNLTYLLRFENTELVLRRPPFGAAIKSAHDMSREFRILAALHPVYSRAPRPLHYCDNSEIAGAPFYVMERVVGVVLRADMTPERAPDRDSMRTIAGNFVESLAELHRLDYQAAGLGDLGRPEGYIQRQVEGWIKRYHQAATQEVPAMAKVGNWLLTNQPASRGSSLIHNDFKYDNIVLDATDLRRVVAVLDWEMATIGDSLMDLGTTLGYWTEANDPPELHKLQLSPTTLPGNPGRAEIVQAYALKSGRDVSDVLFYYVFGVYKIAVIIQQIYKRYMLGHTRDPRFAGLLAGVQAFSGLAAQAVHKRHIDNLY